MNLGNRLAWLSCLALSTAEPTFADPWSEGRSFTTECGQAVVLDSLTSTRIRARAESGSTAVLEIEWLLINPAPSRFEAAGSAANGATQSITRMGKTTFKRTFLARKDLPALFIHCLVDQPGDLTFRATLVTDPPSPIRIEDRRQLVATPPPGAMAAHAWVIPFESDVAAEGSSILLRGEGEALVILVFSEKTAARKTLSQTWAELGNTYDPGHFPPDPAKIWDGLLKSRPPGEDKP